MNDELYPIRDKLLSGVDITEAEADALYASTDLLALGRLAEIVDARISGTDRTLVSARRIRYSNVCRNQCRYCVSAKRPGDPGAYTRSVSEVVDLVGEAVQAGIDQFQLTGGTNPDVTYDYYLDMLSAIRGSYPYVHLQGFAPAQLSAITVMAQSRFTDVLADLRDAGLDSILEDGADIFDPTIRRVLCGSKATGGQWLQVMRDAHSVGLVGGASMLYGHYEGAAERVHHLSYLRDLQDETGGFTFYAPRAYQPNENGIDPGTLVGGTEDMREFAVARVFLTDVPHIRCYANDLGMKTTQIALHFGVDTVVCRVHDDEPLHDDRRAALKLPNATQLRELIEHSGFDVRAAALDQRSADYTLAE